MEDGTLANGSDAELVSHFAAGNHDDVAVETEEIARLKKQVELLAEEVKSSGSKIVALDDTIAENARERDGMLRRIEELETELKALDSVAARANVLEGEVMHLQEELDAVTAGSEDARLELQKSQFDLEELRKQKAAVEVVIAGLEERIAALLLEKMETESKVVERDRKIEELEALLKARKEESKEKEVDMMVLVEKLDRAAVEAKEKDTWLMESRKAAIDAVAELEALKEALDSSAKARDAEVCGKNGRSGCCSDYFKNSWVVAAASAGVMATLTATMYLHFSRKRLA